VVASAADHAARILGAKLMGEAPKARATRPRAVPETRLNLKLIGVLATGTSTGMAIISDSRGEEKVYRVGSRLPGGAVLREVMADRVMLEGASGLEALKLFQPESSDAELISFSDATASGGGVPRSFPNAPSSLAAARSALSGLRAGRARGGDPGPGGQGAGGGFAAGGYNVLPGGSAASTSAAAMERGTEGDLSGFADGARDGLDTSDLGQLRDELVRNPSQLAGLVSAREVRRDGAVVGYALDFQVDDPAIAQLGLQSGDVVTEVNGIQLDGPTQGLRALNALSQASQISATVERGGEVVQVSYNLQ
jgi:type II secretory pathway component PulC